MYLKREIRSMMMHRIRGNSRIQFCKYVMKFVERRKYRGNMWCWSEEHGRRKGEARAGLGPPGF